MNKDRPRPTLVYSRPKAWIADATIDDTRAFVERWRRAWLAPAVPVPVLFTTPEGTVRRLKTDERA